MAMIKCIECGKKVSDEAKTCPHCGITLKEGFFEKAKAKATRLAKEGNLNKKANKVKKQATKPAEQTNLEGEVSIEFFKKRENIIAALLFIFFFLPWVSIFGNSISGSDIPGTIKALGRFGSFFSTTNKMNPQVYLAYVLYLIPICSISTILLSAGNKSTTISSLTAGTIPIIAFVYALINYGLVLLC